MYLVPKKESQEYIVDTRRVVVNQVKEHDAIHVSNLDESAGSFIKNKALEKYEDFSNQVTQQQSMISLGMNSLLDLSYAFEER